MRQQGRITGWKDEQGFGFIEPDGGGAPVFVHIKSFTDRRRRPGGGERVSYVPGRNAQGNGAPRMSPSLASPGAAIRSLRGDAVPACPRGLSQLCEARWQWGWPLPSSAC